jgi:antitoxin component YwqK of YwqJK toxin-antitoxin module
VPDGEWKYYNAAGGVIKTEKYDRGSLVTEPEKITAVAETPKVETPAKEKVKTKEILDYEKKYSKKKRQSLERVGKTGL